MVQIRQNHSTYADRPVVLCGNFRPRSALRLWPMRTCRFGDVYPNQVLKARRRKLFLPPTNISSTTSTLARLASAVHSAPADSARILSRHLRHRHQRMTESATAPAYEFPSGIKSSFVYWAKNWSKSAATQAEEAIVKRGLGDDIPLVDPSEAAQGSSLRAVLHNVQLEGSAKDPRRYMRVLEIGRPTKSPDEHTVFLTHGLLYHHSQLKTKV